MNIIDNAALPATENLRLADLTLSDLNPREDAPEDQISALAASIRQIGLIQNLAGLRQGSIVEIVAGGRRLRALRQIAEEDGIVPEDMIVPVIVTDNIAEARSWAGAENVVRQPLHPADEIRAFAQMARADMPAPEIAKAFGTTIRHVQGRLKLANLPAPILDALRAGDITLDIAAAYTVANDEAHAIHVFESLGNTWMATNIREIKARLTGADHTRNKLQTLVGRARYEAEGGHVTEDLFGDEIYFTDHELLAHLATDKLESERAIHLAGGWKWAEFSFDRPDYDTTAAMGRTYPVEQELGEEDAARYAVLNAAFDNDEISEAEEAELEALEQKLDLEHYSTEQMAHAGVLLWIGHNGEIQCDFGLIRPDDRSDAEAAGICRASSHHRENPSNDSPKRAYSGALSADLARIRTRAAQTALLGKPELALDLLTFILSEQVGWSGKPLGITTEPASNAPGNPQGESEAGEQGLTQDPRLAPPAETAFPMSGDTAHQAFMAFREKPKKERNATLTAAIARLFSVRLTDDSPSPLAEAVASMAGINTRSVWTPGESFLKRLKGPQLDQVMADIMGDGLPAAFAKMKKAEKVARLAKIFAGEKTIPPLTPAQKARADAWLPEGMAIVEIADADATAPVETPEAGAA